MLEDRDGDGVFDHSTVFADKLTLPAGAVWHRNNLYVASPPELLRFDGESGRKETVVSGWNMSSNAASLHGPFFGPDGMLYLTDGRHGFKIKTRDGREFSGMASRIWRLRPDGTGLEWLAGGGFDNRWSWCSRRPGNHRDDDLLQRSRERRATRCCILWKAACIRNGIRW
jgi:glucose/arabinose dehydrogenase